MLSDRHARDDIMQGVLKTPPGKQAGFNGILSFKKFYHKQRNDIYYLYHRVNSWASSVFVRVAYCVASDCCFMRVTPLAPKITFFNVLFGIVPGSSASGHGNTNEYASHNRTNKQPTKRGCSQEITNQNWNYHWN